MGYQMKQATHFFIALTAAVLVASCEKEEEVALTMSGTWETSTQLFTRTFRGQTLNTVRTEFYMEHEREHATVGDGFAVEYYDNALLPMTYHHIMWETWTRKNGDVGIEVKYSETGDKFSTTSYSLNDNSFSGQCSLNDGPDMPFSFKRGTLADLSLVKHWGYNELIPTWHPVTYEGQLAVRREYQGTVYTPTSVVITFDVDPVYNEGGPWNGMACVRENYDDAPWGEYLADSIRSWRKVGSTIDIDLQTGGEGFNGSYSLWNVEATEATLKGEFVAATNTFIPFTMQRVDNPDWSTITQWGITNRMK